MGFFKAIELKDIGKLKQFGIGLNDGINIITGRNKSGKTTMLKAMQMLVTGDASGKDRKDMINTNVPKAKGEISGIVDYNGEHTIKRVIDPAKVEYDGLKQTLSKRKDIDALNDKGYQKNVLSMLCDNYNFFELPAAEQQKILFNYFSGTDAIDMTAYGIDASDKNEFIGLTSANIAAFHKKFYDERYGNNKTIETIEGTISGLKTAITENATVESEDAVKEEIKKLKSELKSYKKVSEQAQQKYQSTLSEIENMKRWQYQPKNTKAIADINSKGLKNKEIIDKIAKFDGKCPLVNSISCASGEVLKEFAKSLVAENELLKPQIVKLAEEDRLSAAEFVADQQAKITDKLIVLEEARSALLAEEDAVKTHNDSLTLHNKAIDDKVTALNIKLSQIVKAKQLEAEIRMLETNLADKNNRNAKLEIWLDLLGKGSNGIVHKIVGNNLDVFFKSVNQISVEKFGFEFERDASIEEFGILVNKLNSNQLSSSEKIITSVAIQVAIAKISGYNFIMVDDIERLESGYIMDLIDSLGSQQIQAILGGHNLSAAMFPRTVNFITMP